MNTRIGKWMDGGKQYHAGSSLPLAHFFLVRGKKVTYWGVFPQKVFLSYAAIYLAREEFLNGIHINKESSK